jgi:ADP-ribose pyrophosphatase YjhB (NUDIX family)
MPYCQQCGNLLTTQIPPGDDQERLCCPNCHFVSYQNPAVLVGVFLYHKNKTLWIKRGTNPNQGKWTFPAGFLEPGESIQEAAVRELYEETTIRRKPEEMVPFGMLSLIPMHQIYLSFRCRCESMTDAAITQEAEDWGWFSEEEAPWDQLAYPESEKQARKTYQWLREGNFPMLVGKTDHNGMFHRIYNAED